MPSMCLMKLAQATAKTERQAWLQEAVGGRHLRIAPKGRGSKDTISLPGGSRKWVESFGLPKPRKDEAAPKDGQDEGDIRRTPNQAAKARRAEGR
ncbi:hypothetical protein C2845_PM09G07300 [Panicum miliaceum]|uniref:Uncharacterized protein n=1 Tax=Panicum miliaceum TaxID=4540 RepID=A0A3L6S5G9_PANMI|nr:hypothetical protein C2845_PM09G07300 [Panicum miliaceum]